MCSRSLILWVSLALSLIVLNRGNSTPASMLMTEIVTSSSMSVNALNFFIGKGEYL